jgi:hypothetical protein
VRAERFSQRAFQSSLGGTLEEDLAHCVSGQPGAFNHATTVDLPKQRAGGDLGQLQPGFEGGDRAGVVCPPVGEGDLGAFPLCVRLRTCVEIKESS